MSYPDPDLNLLVPPYRERATKLSVYFSTGNHGWGFAVPTNKIKEEGGVSYYRIDLLFGVVEQRESRPNKFMQTGAVGDYLTIDTLGSYGVMKKKVYDALTLKRPTYLPKHIPISSEALEDLNFLTKIAEKYEGSSSNSIQGGSTAVRAPLLSGGTPGGSRYDGTYRS